MKKNIKAILILENGKIFKGKAFGYTKETVGEVVFTTSMTGYQETLTDPSFAGQIVTMTYPLIGNYGINLEDMESRKPFLKGFIVREICDLPNNWRCEIELDGFLNQHRIMGLEGIDTRALTRVLRDNGTMKGIITVREDLTESQIKHKFENFTNKNAVKEVTVNESYTINGNGTHLVVLDFGIKKGILKELEKRGCKLTVFPAFATLEEILSVKPDAVFLGNGPGDPKDIPTVIEVIKKLIDDYKIPLLGICLGHQILGLAMGCNTKRLKFGHHGGNHPVKDLKTGKIYITSQNHEFVVCDLTDQVEPTFFNINDGSIEGIKHKTKPIYSVQFHPEANPGPLDMQFLFDRFLKIIEEVK